MDMGSALIERAEFARRAGVHPSSVTVAATTELADACIGNKIDASHPSALAYVRKVNRPRNSIDATTGLDVLYQEVLAWCLSNRNCNILAVKNAFHIGSTRARAMVDIIKLSGELPNSSSGVPVPDAPTVPVAPSYRPAVPIPNLAGGNGAGAGIPPSAVTGMAVPKGHDPVADVIESIEVPEEIQSVADMSLREIIALYGTNTRFIEWLKAVQAIEAIEEKRLKNAKAEGALVSRELVADYVIEPIDATIRQMLTDGVKTIVARVIAMHEAGNDIPALEALVADQMTSFFKPMKKKIVRGLKNA